MLCRPSFNICNMQLQNHRIHGSEIITIPFAFLCICGSIGTVYRAIFKGYKLYRRDDFIVHEIFILKFLGSIQLNLENENWQNPFQVTISDLQNIRCSRITAYRVCCVANVM